jgi:outer membrane receptor protein involved in Fe transport
VTAAAERRPAPVPPRFERRPAPGTWGLVHRPAPGTWGRDEGRAASATWGRDEGRAASAAWGRDEGRAASAAWGRDEGRAASATWGRGERRLAPGTWSRGQRRGARLAVVLAVLAAAGPARAEDPLAEVTDVQELSLADLLDTRVDIAARKPQTARETPGIVTVISREDILASGARELLDVLALVPGFSPAVDVVGVVDVGVRGQWAHEGKMLLLVDGQPLNELLYSSLQLANHYPLEAVDHIEVIRGPGSVIYGGYAELAVINIVTRDAASLAGVALAGSYGQLGPGVGHANANLAFGTTTAGGLAVSGSLLVGHATTRGTYTDFADRSYPLAGASDRDPMFLKLAVAYRALRIDAIVDDYRMTSRDTYGRVDPVTSRAAFKTLAVDARYAVALPGDLTLTPRFSVLRQTPWQVTDPASMVFYSKTITRYTPGATLAWAPTRGLDLLLGAEAYFDRAHVDDQAPGRQLLFGGRADVAYDTLATYAQVLVSHPIANLTVGARYEHQGGVGGSLVPRIALTRVMGPVHAKLLASQAYRAPSVENLNVSGGSLRPERTTAFEAELGAELGSSMFLSANAFDTTIRHPIIYEYDQATAREAYQNFARTGTRGVELDYRLKVARGSAALTYSYYTAAGKNDVDAYRVPGRDDVLLAFPTHKLTATGSLALTPHLSFAPSAIVYGPRYGYLSGDASGTPVLGRAPTTALLHAYLRWRDALFPGLELGAGLYNLTNARFDYLQPYAGGHPPLPSPGRELVFRVAYEHKL